MLLTLSPSLSFTEAANISGLPHASLGFIRLLVLRVLWNGFDAVLATSRPSGQSVSEFNPGDLSDVWFLGGVCFFFLNFRFCHTKPEQFPLYSEL